MDETSMVAMTLRLGSSNESDFSMSLDEPNLPGLDDICLDLPFRTLPEEGANGAIARISSKIVRYEFLEPILHNGIFSILFRSTEFTE